MVERQTKARLAVAQWVEQLRMAAFHQPKSRLRDAQRCAHGDRTTRGEQQRSS